MIRGAVERRQRRRHRRRRPGDHRRRPAEGLTEPSDTSAPTAPTLVDTTLPVLVVEGGEVFLVPFDESGDDSFTPSIATAADDVLMAFVEAGGPPSPTAENRRPVIPATTPRRSSACPEPTTACSPGPRAWRHAHPINSSPNSPPDAPETAAWADIQQIDVDSVGSFIDGLTSVVLTADTRVTDHEFVDGVARPRQVVLQVGHRRDGGRVRRTRGCAAPAAARSHHRSRSRTAPATSAWPGTRSQTGGTVAVVPAAAPVDEFVLTDVAAGPDFIRPVGSSGATDRPLLPGEVLATGSFTSFTGLDQGAIGSERRRTHLPARKVAT